MDQTIHLGKLSLDPAKESLFFEQNDQLQLSAILSGTTSAVPKQAAKSASFANSTSTDTATSELPAATTQSLANQIPQIETHNLC